MCSTPLDGKRKEGLLGLKLETSKAYNLVEWVFLTVKMERLGFGGRCGLIALWIVFPIRGFLS